MTSGGPPLGHPRGISISSSSLTGGNTITTNGLTQLNAQSGNQAETMMATSTSTSPTPSDSTSVSAESGKSGLAGTARHP